MTIFHLLSKGWAWTGNIITVLLNVHARVALLYVLFELLRALIRYFCCPPRAEDGHDRAARREEDWYRQLWERM